MGYELVLSFWFDVLSPEQWWQKNTALDTQIEERFGELHRQASLGELWHWRSTPEGRLAEIIILDQFSRHIYRGDPRSYAFDGMAVLLTQQAIDVGADQALPTQQRPFLYMPLMHSESALLHEKALELFRQPGLEHHLDFEQQHAAIIQQFGRYPHRNEILGRISTDSELEFLKTNPGF